MGRILVRWKSFTSNLEILCHATHSDNLWCEIVWYNMCYITCVIQHILTTYNVRCSTFWQLTNRRVSENELHRCKCYIWPCVTSVMFDSLRLPTDGGDRTLIVTTAKISYKFSRDSPYISNKFSRKSTRFQTCFHWSQRSPRNSKDVSGKLIDLEIQISFLIQIFFFLDFSYLDFFFEENW